MKDASRYHRRLRWGRPPGLRLGLGHGNDFHAYAGLHVEADYVSGGPVGIPDFGHFHDLDQPFPDLFQLQYQVGVSQGADADQHLFVEGVGMHHCHDGAPVVAHLFAAGEEVDYVGVFAVGDQAGKGVNNDQAGLGR